MALRDLANRIKFSIDDKPINTANDKINKYQQNLVATTKSTTTLETQTVASSRNMSISLTALETAFKAIIGYVFILSSRSLVDLAAQAETVEVKFAGAFYGIEEFANVAVADLTKNYGLSNLQAEQLLANTGDLLKGFGATSAQALDTSTEVQKLAIALGAYNNVPVADASYAVTSALLGEREMIKRLGVVIREADVQQRLLEKGQSNLTGQAKLLATAQATLELATEQSTDAVSKFGDLTETNAFKMQQLNAQVQDLQVQLGTHLLPIVGFISDNFDTLTSVVFGLTFAFATYKTGLLIMAAVQTIATLETLTLTGALTALNLAFLVSPLGLFAIALGAIVAVTIYLYKNFESVRNAIDSTYEKMKAFILFVQEKVMPLLKLVYMLTPMGMAMEASNIIQNVQGGTYSAPAPTAQTTTITNSSTAGGNTYIQQGSQVTIQVEDTDSATKIKEALLEIDSTNKAMTGERAFPNLQYQ